MRDPASTLPHCDVLCIDDESVVREAVQRILHEEGLSVVTLPDAGTAIAHAARRTCRLVLVDLMLPDSSGCDLIRTLHASRPDVPLIAVTGYATPENEEAARRAGAAELLPKPFTEAELVACVRRALAARTPEARRMEP